MSKLKTSHLAICLTAGLLLWCVAVIIDSVVPALFATALTIGGIDGLFVKWIQAQPQEHNEEQQR